MQRAEQDSVQTDLAAAAAPPPDGATSIAVGRHDAGHIVEGVRREWLVTSGRGDYGMGTTNLLATRRYHGLLVAACDAPIGRRMLVPFVDETVRSGGSTVNLGTRRWADGSVDPDGHRAVAAFTLEDGVPTWRFELEGARLEKRVTMLRDSRGVAIVWTLAEGGSPVSLDAAVFVEHRSHHRLDPDASWMARVHSESDDGARAQIELPANPQAATPTLLHVAGQGAALSPAGVWWRRHTLAEESARGYDAIGSALHALTASFVIAPGHSVALCLSLERIDGAIDGDAIVASARARARALVSQSGLSKAPAALRSLALAADGFLVRRARSDGSEGRSIIAGYPWFEDWGRDAMLSLRGLCLSTGRTDDAKLVLETFADHLRDGLLPNRFPDLSGVPEYHSADAPLLFLRACCDTFRATRDDAWIARMWPRMRSVVAAYARGTMHGIGVDVDGLVRAGEAGLQLTWMDAKLGDTVVTPRMGKPVELTALWIDALRSMCEIAPDDTADLAELAARAERSFARFWNPATQCLFDVLDAPSPAGGTQDDAAVRPNQLFALAARHSPLPEAWRAAALSKVRALLAVPLAVRTLPVAAPEYRGRCEGDQRSRDYAYHQGTAWPFLAGLLLDAERIAAPAQAAAHARALLADLAEHLADGGIGSVSEIMDGDAPHEPRGCPMQAWSVACLLGALRDALPAECLR